MSRVVQIFNTGGLPGAAHHWRAHVKAARAASAALGDRMLEIRYEDLVSRPQEQLERLCTFLGLPFEVAMLDHGASPEVIPQHRFDVHPRERLQPGLRRWRTELSRDEISVIEFIASGLMDELGYEREVGELTRGAAAMIGREWARRAHERWLQRGAPRLGMRLRRPVRGA